MSSSQKRLPAFSVYCLSGICTTSPWLQIHFNITLTFFFQVQNPRILGSTTFSFSWPPRGSPACHPSLSPVLQSVLSSERLAQVPALGRLCSREAAAAHCLHQCQRYCLHGNWELFVFLMKMNRKNRKSTSGVAISAAPCPPACQSQQETIPQF